MPKSKAFNQRTLDGELGLIIDELGRAMWNADKEYIGRSLSILSLTPNMRVALAKFQEFCVRNYGKKA